LKKPESWRKDFRGMSDKAIIYMPLQDEGTLVWRPVEARILGDCYCVIGSMPNDESWKFSPGTVVKCEFAVLSDGTRGLVPTAISD
jgi:hypothetical protein